MRDFLVFTLTAALGSMGELAGHERRGSWTWPGKSAVLGLLGAARGVRRDGDFSALDALSVAVAVFDAGAPLRDYHTAQTVPTAKAKRPQSRPAALREAGREVNTTISLRDYRACPLYGVAVAGDGLDMLKDALERPVFTLYLGRKSCPLAAPLAPRIVAAESPASALQSIVLPPWWTEHRKPPVSRLLFVDQGEGGVTETRHDAPRDRRAWHFEERRFARVEGVCIEPGRGAPA